MFLSSVFLPCLAPCQKKCAFFPGLAILEVLSKNLSVVKKGRVERSCEYAKLRRSHPGGTPCMPLFPAPNAQGGHWESQRVCQRGHICCNLKRESAPLATGA